MGKLTKVKAIELVFDWNLWPRCESGDLDSTNISRMKDSLRAGLELPPVVVNKKDMRIVDGFHRTNAILSLYGDDAEISVELVDYQNDGDIFLDSVRYNSRHGLPMSPKDKAHAFLKARKMKIPTPAIAEALGMNVEKAKEFIERRTAKTKSGERIALPGGALALSGKILTEDQEKFAKSANGAMPSLNARLLLNALKAEAVIFDAKTIKLLIDVKNEIERILSEVAA